MIDNKLTAAVDRIANAVWAENVDTIETGPDKGKKITLTVQVKRTVYTTATIKAAFQAANCSKPANSANTKPTPKPK